MPSQPIQVRFNYRLADVAISSTNTVPLEGNRHRAACLIWK